MSTDELWELREGLVDHEQRIRAFARDVHEMIETGEIPDEIASELLDEVAVDRAELDRQWAMWDGLMRSARGVTHDNDTFPPAAPPVATARRTSPRARGAGRPAARAVASRDGPDGELADEPPLARLRRALSRAWRRAQ